MISEFNKDLRVPSALIAKIEQRIHLHNKKEDEGFDSKLLAFNKTRKFLPVKIFLEPLHKGVLYSSKPYLIELIRDDSLIDLSHFVSSKRGSFRIRFALEDRVSLEHFYIFYVSGAKKRTIDGREFGMGCQSFSEISKFFKKELLKEGLETNTTKGRHLALLAGTYILVAPENEEYKMIAFSIYDSRYPDWQCEELI
ncbi:MAG: hypothetical protein D6797_01045 [Bdellovibrio sp.]|nr:MAG: hypothetical protein D6797_01045 [Bdellovibrio sp.]